MSTRIPTKFTGILVPSRNAFVVVTMKGLELVRQWFNAPRIPSELVRTYQMLLRLTWNKGRLRADIALRYWDHEILTRGIKNGYIQVVGKATKLPVQVQRKISSMIDRPGRRLCV